MLASLDTIIPPNHLNYEYENDKLAVYETERKTLDEIREEKDQYKHDYPLYRQLASLWDQFRYFLVQSLLIKWTNP